MKTHKFAYKSAEIPVLRRFVFYISYAYKLLKNFERTLNKYSY